MVSSPIHLCCTRVKTTAEVSCCGFPDFRRARHHFARHQPRHVSPLRAACDLADVQLVPAGAQDSDPVLGVVVRLGRHLADCTATAEYGLAIPSRRISSRAWHQLLHDRDRARARQGARARGPPPPTVQVCERLVPLRYEHKRRIWHADQQASNVWIHLVPRRVSLPAVRLVPAGIPDGPVLLCALSPAARFGDAFRGGHEAVLARPGGRHPSNGRLRRLPASPSDRARKLRDRSLGRECRRRWREARPGCGERAGTFRDRQGVEERERDS